MRELKREILQQIVDFVFETVVNLGCQGILLKDAKRQIKKLIEKHVEK